MQQDPHIYGQVEATDNGTMRRCGRVLNGMSKLDECRPRVTVDCVGSAAPFRDYGNVQSRTRGLT